MKKSKFLKKSLAMLLALMLVVAMIPLSASAATPVMRQVDVTAGGQVVQLVPGEGANTLEGEISNLSQNITLTVLAGKDNVVYYTNKATSATSDTRATASANGTWTIEIGAADVAEYEDDNGDIVIDFSVADADKPATRIDHTVILTPVDVETTTEIERFTINNVNNQNVQLGETVIGAEDIYFTVPYDAAEIDGAEFRIRELEMASATATVSFSRNGSLDYYYTTEAATDKIVTDGNPVVNIQDGDEMTITNNSSTKKYTLHITPASGFTSFTTKEGLDAVMFTDTGDIAVLLPYGYSWDKDTISVTPVFDLDHERATATWTSGTPITVDTDDVITSSTFETFLEQETEWYNKNDDAADARSWEFRKNTDPLNKTFADFVRYSVDARKASQVEITYSENASRTYNVYFFEPFENQAAEITELTIGSETAVIDEANKTIDITLPMGTDVSDLNNGASYVNVDMVASNGATVDIPMQNVSFTESTPARARYAAFDTASRINATNSVQIRVVSEDGLTEEFYTLNVSVSDEFVKPALTDISIQSPDGVTIDGEITTDKNNINVVNFEVPYEVYNRGELNDWKLFYTKTIGSTISYEDADGDNVALPKSGAEIGDAPYIPDPNATELTATPIDLHVAGQELSAQATSYTIMITRAAAQTTSTLSEFSLVGVPDFANYDDDAAGNDYHDTADIDGRFVYDATIKTEGDDEIIEVKVPWSVYAQWELDETFEALATAAEGANAKVFFVSGNGDWVVELDPDGAPSVKDDVGNSIVTTNNWTLYHGAKIIVMSEQLWVNLQNADTDNNGIGDTYLYDNPPASELKWMGIGKWNAWSAESDMGNFTEYTLEIVQDTAGTNNELKDLKLVDGTGWTAPLSIITRGEAGRIEGSVPYALTSDIRNPKTWNPVYLEYNTSPYAFVLGVEDVNYTEPSYIEYGTWPNNMSRPWFDDNEDNYKVPTSGTDKNGVFVDMADYLALYDNNYDLALAHYFTDGNPFFLIDRNGDVYIYNGTNDGNNDPTDDVLTLNQALEENRIAVAAEDGTPYTQYVIDLDVDPANNGTEVTSFYFEEYPTRKGVIDDTNKTITVTLPYGTEYTYLTPNYTVSEGAIVTIDDPELQGKPLFPGYTDVNFSTSRKMTVIAENESDSTEYTIRVEIEAQFSDVKPSDWFYGNVMDAAANGYVSGMGDGTFNPKGATTRAQFASMIAKAMGYDDSLAGETRFKDVPADQWYAGAITYCFDNDIISGYDDGTFQPEKTITRQEAASILKNAFNLTGNSGEKFPDDSAIAGWAKENVYAVKHSGLMKGDADTGNFRPTSTIIRAEAASILMNANRAGLIK